MTDPKKLLQNKLQNRLKQPNSDLPKPLVSEYRSASEKSKKSIDLTPAQRPANKPTPKDASKPPVAANVEFNKKLEALIVGQNQPEQAPVVEQVSDAKVAANKPKQVTSKVKKIKPPKPPKPKRKPLTAEQRSRLLQVMVFYLLAVVIVVLDQATKLIIEPALIGGEILVTSWFDLRLVYNPGAAFSMFANSSWQRPFLVAVSSVVSLVLVFWLARMPLKQKRVLSFGLVCILGGAVGNLIDRVLYGHVIDFISVHYQQFRFPTFNIADSMITIGAMLLLLDMLFFDRSPDRSKPDSLVKSNPSGKKNQDDIQQLISDIERRERANN